MRSKTYQRDERTSAAEIRKVKRAVVTAGRGLGRWGRDWLCHPKRERARARAHVLFCSKTTDKVVYLIFLGQSPEISLQEGTRPLDSTGLSCGGL